MYRLIADTLITAVVLVFVVCGLEDTWREFVRAEERRSNG